MNRTVHIIKFSIKSPLLWDIVETIKQLVENISFVFIEIYFYFGDFGGLCYLQISHDTDLGKKRKNFLPCFKDMKCVHDSEIIFRHVKVTHRKYCWL